MPIFVITMIVYSLSVNLHINYLLYFVKIQELNTAEDFISLYEEIMPYTQTLPLVLLHKESLITKLLSRLHINARLSLDAILRYANANLFQGLLHFCMIWNCIGLYVEMATMNKSYCYVLKMLNTVTFNVIVATIFYSL